MTKSKPINFFNAWNGIKYGEKIRLKNRNDRIITKKKTPHLCLTMAMSLVLLIGFLLKSGKLLVRKIQ